MENSRGGWSLGKEAGEETTAAGEANARLWLRLWCLSIEI